MFVPIVPFVPHTTVVNKTIVYSDTVLPLKDAGSNLKVTSISNVGEFSLESCLKTIFESNPNVVFNTIQYSKSDKKVYFYTNTEISKKAWEDSKVSTYKPLTSSSEILEEVKRVLLAEKNKDEDCISLYDIAKLMKKANNDYDRIVDSYKSCCSSMIKSRFGNSTSLIIYDFDYDKNELRIGFNYVGDDYDKIIFSKKNGDLYISKSESCWGKDVFAVLGAKLSKLYDELMSFSVRKKEKSYGLRAVNSNFLVDISSYGVDIFVRSSPNQFMKDFELSSHSYSNDYKCNCNSSIVISAFQGKESEIFRRIFVNISDCPEWSQPILYEIRQNQLAEEQRIEDEQRYREMKKQKRLELTRKIFPFLKK